MATISIRPAPHAKYCALDRHECSNSDTSKCFSTCTRCCELKHCWNIGYALQQELVKRGHIVIMADFTKQLHDSAADTRAVIDTAVAAGADLHVAIHTNANGNTNVRGINIGYKAGSDKGKHAAAYMQTALKSSANYDDKVNITDGYDFIEINRPEAAGLPAIYIEAGYGDSNKADAEWIHNNIPAIASAMADGIEAFAGKPAPIVPPTPSGDTVTVNRAELQAIYDNIGKMLNE